MDEKINVYVTVYKKGNLDLNEVIKLFPGKWEDWKSSPGFDPDYEDEEKHDFVYENAYMLDWDEHQHLFKNLQEIEVEIEVN